MIYDSSIAYKGDRIRLKNSIKFEGRVFYGFRVKNMIPGKVITP
jgi:hypothetical protein